MPRTLFAACLAGHLVLAGCDGGPRDLEATITRDAWGVPHVQSLTDAGAVFGMAWALAEDDWPLIEANYLSAIGRSAERLGPDALPDDWMARTLEIERLSIREYQQVPASLRAMLDAYASGSNAWLATQPDTGRVLERVEPWFPLALIRYKYYQNEFLGYAGLRDAWVERLLADGLPTPGGARPAKDGTPMQVAMAPRYREAHFDPLGVRPRGSNQWAVAASRTATGHPLLLINPHQQFVGVQRYAEIHLDSDEGLHFSGLTVFGFALPYMGNGERHGWAYTDNYADHSDLYALRIDDSSGTLRYRYADSSRGLREWSDTALVRTDSGLEPHILHHWGSHHGPVVGVDTLGRPLAVRMARYEEGGWLEQWDAMIRARSLDEWQGAVGRLRVAYMNVMYADREGNIGYIYGSAVPRRAAGVDPSGILDGDNPEHEWQEFHGLAELPQIWNPAAGWLVNTNSAPMSAQDSAPFTRAEFPPYMIGDETDNARARSSRHVLRDATALTLDRFAVLAWDSRLSAADSLVPMLLSAMAGATSDPELARMIAALAAWDRRTDTASVESTWFILANERRILAERGERSPANPWHSALDEARNLLRDHWGTVDVPWGALSRHQRPLPGAATRFDSTRQSLAVGGGPGFLGSVFTFNTTPIGSPAPRLGTSGNSFVKVIEFGPQPQGRSIINYGQSGDPASAHFFDQAVLYARRQFKPAWWTREEVKANATRTYVVKGSE